jgi:cytochrome c oxidase assembly protein subunit 11
MTESATRMPRRATRRDLVVAAVCGAFAACMVGAAYAAVPLYDWFCRVTGFAGTTMVASAPPGYTVDRDVVVRFDSNINGGLPWRFTPERTSVSAKLGEVVTVYYSVTNLSARETWGQASYNVAPLTVGGYFHKINCFCFTDQRLGPGERRDMAVVFYVDPKLAQDAEHDGLNTITLSYTFFSVRPPAQPVASAGGTELTGRGTRSVETR